MSDRYADYDRLVMDRPAEGVLRITMDGPNKLNSADFTMHKELVTIWKDADDDPETNSIILTGAGTAFSAGGDISMLEAINSDHDALLRGWREAKDIPYNVINCSKPVIAAIQGPAVGAGLSAGMAADIILVTPTTRIIDGHTRLGVAAGDHSVLTWPLMTSMAKAKYYLLTCEPLSGEEAERIGLASLCVGEDELQDKAVEVALSLANGAQSAIRFTKYALNNWFRAMGPSFDVSTALEMINFAGPDAAEGINALKEKRPAKFGKQVPS